MSQDFEAITETISASQKLLENYDKAAMEVLFEFENHGTPEALAKAIQQLGRVYKRMA